MVKEISPEHQESIAHRLRVAAGLTQEDAAATLHISIRAWQRFESQERALPERIVREFCARTQLDERDFLESERE